MKILIKDLVVSVCMVATIAANAQEVLPINLETVLELSGANNLTIREFQAKQELSAASLSKSREWWLPDVYAGLQTHQLYGAAMNADGRFFLDVNRQSLWAGLGLNASLDFAEGIYKVKASKWQVQAAVYETQAMKSKVILESIETYYDLQTAQMEYVAYQSLIAQSDTITQQIAFQVDAGLRYQSELLLSKSNQSHLRIEMLNAQLEYSQKSAELVRLLNLDSKVKLVSVDEVMLPLYFQQEILMVSDSAYENRPEMKAIEFTVRSLQAERKITTTGLIFPTFGVGAYGSYFGRISGQVSPMFPLQYPETKQLYPTGALNASLTWTIPLGRLVYGGDVQRYNSQVKVQEVRAAQFKAQISKEISIATQQLLNGREQFQIAKEAIEITAEALSQSIERQKLGTAMPFEVFQAQQFFLEAQVDYFKAIGRYNKAQFGLKAALGELR
ncbi:MAG: TolC family protein [Saprospiraceae bacterium]|nr:TolC family protein [Saprospiraceae bacterium]